MPAKHRRTLRVVFPALLLVSSGLVALSLVQGTQEEETTGNSGDLLNVPELTLNYGRQQLQLSIASASPEHEEAVLRAIQDQFGDLPARVDFHTALLIESNWPLVSTRLLYLVGATSSARVDVQDQLIRIRGTTDDAAIFEQRLKQLREVLPAGSELDADVVMIGSDVAGADLCERSFATIGKETVHFRQSSIRLRESSFPVLDRLVEFAYDCRDMTIAIIGHTDSTGDESWNKQVSLARAKVVADYMTARGIPAERMLLEGAGSQHPIGDNGTVAGRERNRRIEFELR